MSLMQRSCSTFPCSCPKAPVVVCALQTVLGKSFRPSPILPLGGNIQQKHHNSAETRVLSDKKMNVLIGKHATLTPNFDAVAWLITLWDHENAGMRSSRVIKRTMTCHGTISWYKLPGVHQFCFERRWCSDQTFSIEEDRTWLCLLFWKLCVLHHGRATN